MKAFETPSPLRLCTAAEMQTMDQRSIEVLGIPGLILMENAARSLADWLDREYLANHPKAQVVICCGKGNNGGDGYALARLLQNRGYRVAVIEAGIAQTPEARINRQIWGHFGPSFSYPSPESSALLNQADVLVDALLGTGLERPVSGLYAEWIAAMNANVHALKVAVDIPSGLHADHGQILGSAVVCHQTLTFQVGKQGLFQYPGKAYAGKVSICDISIPPYWAEAAPGTYLLTPAWVRTLMPSRPPQAHKGTFGHVLTICGSAGMGGAALLCSRAALKAGAGLVSACVPEVLRESFLAHCPELMTFSPPASQTYFEAESLGLILLEAQKREALVLGCGIGQALPTRALTQALLQTLEKPMVIDADGLNNLAGAEQLEESLMRRPTPAILTPHPKELARMTGLSVQEIQSHRLEVVRFWAKKWGVVLLLKGAGSLVGTPEGDIFINPTGHEGMATAGSGDVLSGIIGGFLAQGCSAAHAALLGVYLHGLAGDCLKSRLAPAFLTASDLIEGLNEALLTLNAENLTPR